MTREFTRERLNFSPLQDWKVNAGNIKGRLVMLLFRLATLIRSKRLLCIVFCWYLFLYRFFVEWLLNIELHWNVRAGKGLCLMHGHGTVVNGSAVIGDNCTLRHLTTIGNKRMPDGSFGMAPMLGNNVDIGANSVILGNITIGDNVTIGAGSIVTKSIPADCVVAGNPAKIIKYKSLQYVS